MVCLLSVFVGCTNYKRHSSKDSIVNHLQTKPINHNPIYPPFIATSKYEINVKVLDARNPTNPQWLSGSDGESPWPLANKVKAIDYILTEQYGKHFCHYRFDEIGRLIELTCHEDAEKDKSRKIHYSYHGNAEQPYSSECDYGWLCNRQFEYEHNGNLTKVTYLNDNNSIHSVDIFEYKFKMQLNHIEVSLSVDNKDSGHVKDPVKLEFFDPVTGRLIGAVYSFGELSFDKGRSVKKPSGEIINYLDRDDHELVKIYRMDPENTSLYHPTEEYTFNKKGLIIGEKRYSYIGSPTVEEVPISYKEDKHGNWIERVRNGGKTTRKISYYK